MSILKLVKKHFFTENGYIKISDLVDFLNRNVKTISVKKRIDEEILYSSNKIDIHDMLKKEMIAEICKHLYENNLIELQKVEYIDKYDDKNFFREYETLLYILNDTKEK